MKKGSRLFSIEETGGMPIPLDDSAAGSPNPLKTKEAFDQIVRRGIRIGPLNRIEVEVGYVEGRYADGYIGHVGSIRANEEVDGGLVHYLRCLRWVFLYCLRCCCLRFWLRLWLRRRLAPP